MVAPAVHVNRFRRQTLPALMSHGLEDAAAVGCKRLLANREFGARSKVDRRRVLNVQHTA